jgi:glucan phosphoethanolaminetransferase (alkaline phosphatase superfamily)
MKQAIITAPATVYQSIAITDNFLDAPLLLIFFLFFSSSALMTKRLKLGLFIFLGLEAIIFVVFGFSVKAVKIILGPDIAVVLLISFMFFLRYVRLAITNSKSLGKAIMISSILLSYSIFSLVYIFFYLIKNRQYREDAQLIYYLISIISALLMAVGILIEKKRIKKLDELKNTRRELAIIYGEKRITTRDKESPFLSHE